MRVIFHRIADAFKAFCNGGAQPGTEALGPGLRRGDEKKQVAVAARL